MANEVKIEVTADTAKASKSFGSLTARMDKFKKVAKVAGLAMVGFGATLGTLAVRSATQFDSAMREVNSLVGLNEKQFGKLADGTREMARTMGVDAVDAASALYQAISAGVPEENALTFMRVASSAAVAGVTDSKTAVDGLTTAMNAWKIETGRAQEVADVMFTAVKLGKTTFGELSAALSQAAPMAAAMGVSLESVMAATASLTKQGVPTTQAMTQIRAVMVSLTKPSEDMAALLSKMGFATGDAALQALGFQGSLEGLRDAADNNNEVLAAAFGRVEGLNAMLALTGDNAEGARSDLTDMAEASEGLGAATEALNEINKGTARQFALIKAQMQSVSIQLGEALLPAIRVLIDLLAPVLEKTSVWIGENPKLAATLLVAATGVGAMSLAVGLLNTAMVGTMVMAAKWLGVFGALFYVADQAAVAFKRIALMGLHVPDEDLEFKWPHEWAEGILQIDALKESIVQLGPAMAGQAGGAADLDSALAELQSGITNLNEGLGVTPAKIGETGKELGKLPVLFDKTRQALMSLDDGLGTIMPSTTDFAEALREARTELWDLAQNETRAAANSLDSLNQSIDRIIQDVMFSNTKAAELGLTFRDVAEAFYKSGGAVDTLKAALHKVPLGDVNALMLELGIKADDVARIMGKLTGEVNDLTAANKKLIATGGQQEATRLGDYAREQIARLPGGTGDPAVDKALVLAANRNYTADEFQNAIRVLRKEGLGAIKLQSGGVVTRPTLALIGEKGPEAVIPLGKGGGSGITINFHGPIYGLADFERKVEMTIRDAIRGGGFYGTPLAV